MGGVAGWVAGGVACVPLAEGADGSSYYHQIIIVDDTGQGSTLWQDQGEGGNMLLQVNTWGGNDSVGVYKKAKALKDVCAGIAGLIGTSPNQFRIWQNVTTEPRTIADGQNENLVWGILFEMTLQWDKV